MNSAQSIQALNKPEQQKYTKIPILKPEEIEKLKSLNFKSSHFEADSDVKCSIRTRGDELTQREMKTCQKGKSNFQQFFKNRVALKTERNQMKMSMSFRVKDQPHRNASRRVNHSFRHFEESKESRICFEKQQRQIPQCCSIFPSRKVVYDNPFMVARSQMINK